MKDPAENDRDTPSRAVTAPPPRPNRLPTACSTTGSWAVSSILYLFSACSAAIGIQPSLAPALSPGIA